MKYYLEQFRNDVDPPLFAVLESIFKSSVEIDDNIEGSLGQYIYQNEWNDRRMQPSSYPNLYVAASCKKEAVRLCQQWYLPLGVKVCRILNSQVLLHIDPNTCDITIGASDRSGEEEFITTIFIKTALGAGIDKESIPSSKGTLHIVDVGHITYLELEEGNKKVRLSTTGVFHVPEKEDKTGARFAKVTSPKLWEKIKSQFDIKATFKSVKALVNGGIGWTATAEGSDFWCALSKIMDNPKDYTSVGVQYDAWYAILNISLEAIDGINLLMYTPEDYTKHLIGQPSRSWEEELVRRAMTTRFSDRFPTTFNLNDISFRTDHLLSSHWLRMYHKNVFVVALSNKGEVATMEVRSAPAQSTDSPSQVPPFHTHKEIPIERTELKKYERFFKVCGITLYYSDVKGTYILVHKIPGLIEEFSQLTSEQFNSGSFKSRIRGMIEQSWVLALKNFVGASNMQYSFNPGVMFLQDISSRGCFRFGYCDDYIDVFFHSDVFKCIGKINMARMEFYPGYSSVTYGKHPVAFLLYVDYADRTIPADSGAFKQAPYDSLGSSLVGKTATPDKSCSSSIDEERLRAAKELFTKGLFAHAYSSKSGFDPIFDSIKDETPVLLSAPTEEDTPQLRTPVYIPLPPMYKPPEE